MGTLSGNYQLVVTLLYKLNEHAKVKMKKKQTKKKNKYGSYTMTSKCSAETQLAFKKQQQKKSKSNPEWTKYVHVTNTAQLTTVKKI